MGNAEVLCQLQGPHVLDVTHRLVPILVQFLAVGWRDWQAAEVAVQHLTHADLGPTLSGVWSGCECECFALCLPAVNNFLFSFFFWIHSLGFVGEGFLHLLRPSLSVIILHKNVSCLVTNNFWWIVL